MTDRRLTMIATAAALILLILGGLLLQSRRSGDEFAGCRVGLSSADVGKLGGPFLLTDETGARVSDSQVFDRPSILYFGYTYCPDVCPMDNARNAAAVDILKGQGVTLKPVFISVDPRRDTPERLGEFTDTMHPDMIGLTGTTEEIAAVTRAWKYIFKIKDEEDKENYLVDHMTNSYLILPGHGTVAAFGRDLTPDDMAKRVACFVGAAANGVK